MSATTGQAASRAFERRLAFVLSSGTWLASAVIAAGLALPSGTAIVNAGIAIFIALPVLRVLLMVVEFARRRDRRMVVVAATVLTIIVLAIVLNLHTKSGGAG